MRAPEELTGAGGTLVRAGEAALLRMLLTLVPSKCISPPPPLFRAHARSRSHFAGISESPSHGSSASGRRPTPPAACTRSHEFPPALLPSATAARLTGRFVSASGRGTLSRRLLTAVSVCRSTCSPSLAKACCIMSSRSRLPCHPRVRPETVLPPPLTIHQSGETAREWLVTEVSIASRGVCTADWDEKTNPSLGRSRQA